MVMQRFIALVWACLFAAAPHQASAQVQLSFYSFNGSVILPGGYPHAYVRLEGTLDETGEKVSKLFGFTADSASAAIAQGDTSGHVHEAKSRYLKGKKNKLHFTVPLSDPQYRQIVAEVGKWRKSTYNLDKRNCLHFVATLARIAGIDAIVPGNLTRKPKSWLNFIGKRNPQLNARDVK